ncbi:MAG: hypothetical protein ACRCY8_10455 [Dermatophilaceae bacterium]
MASKPCRAAVGRAQGERSSETERWPDIAVASSAARWPDRAGHWCSSTWAPTSRCGSGIPERGSHPGAGIVAQRGLVSFVAGSCAVPAARIGVPITARQLVDRNGRVTLLPRRQVATSWSVLHRMLRDRLPSDCYRDGVPVLVVADGSRSGFRKMVSPEASLGYAGYVTMRGTLPESDLGGPLAHRLVGRLTVYDSLGAQFLYYATRSGRHPTRRDGGRLLNWVW